jgi:hypothetical protein
MALIESYLHKLNVVRFESLLANETEPAKRATLADLLAQEHALLARALELEGKSTVQDAGVRDRPT